jgi:hypothetical protein
MQTALIAILAAGLAGWLFGAVWYTTLGKPWQRAHGMNPDDCKDKKMPLTPMVVALLGAILMAAVLYQLLINLGVMGIGHGAIAGLTLGVGFLLTATVVNNQFQGKNWVATAIDGGHWTLVLVIEAVVIMLLA